LLGVEMIQKELLLLWTVKGTQIAREVIAYESQTRENLKHVEDMEEQNVDEEHGISRIELYAWINSEPECTFSGKSNDRESAEVEYDGGGYSGGGYDGGGSSGGGGDGGGRGGGGDW
jgi:uncharacterized membrane protein YgcG